MIIVSALSALLWNSFDNDFVRSTLHAVSSVFFSCLCLDYPSLAPLQTFNMYQSLGYFTADLRYIVSHRQHPSFLVHHLLAIFLIYIFPERHPDTLLYSKLMLIEASTPFINLHLADRSCKIKWGTAAIVFFLVRIVYFPIVVVANISRRDELVYSGLLYLGNLWWFYKHLRKGNKLYG